MRKFVRWMTGTDVRTPTITNKRQPMRRFLLLLVVCSTLFTLNAEAQNGKAVTTRSRWTDYARRQYWGIRVGLNLSDATFSNGDMGIVSTTSRTGFGVAFLYGRQIAPTDVPLFIEFGLKYTQKGFSSKFTTGKKAKDYDYRHNMNMIEVPLHIKYKIKTGVDDLTVQPMFGGFINLGITSDTYVYLPEPRSKCDTFCDNVFARADVGVRVGCGVAYQNFCLEVSYDWGLVNLLCDGSQKYYPMYTRFDETLRNRCLTIALGIDF